jgi:hypothetical protein
MWHSHHSAQSEGVADVAPCVSVLCVWTAVGSQQLLPPFSVLALRQRGESSSF